MIKVEVIESFTLGAFKELKNIKRINKEENGKLFVGDVFECTEEMTKYLTNETPNPMNRAFVKVIEILPEEEKKQEEKPVEKKKTTRRKTTKKAVEKKD